MHISHILTAALASSLLPSTLSQTTLAYPAASFSGLSATIISTCQRVRTILWDGQQLLALCPGRSTLSTVQAVWEDTPGSGQWQNKTILSQTMVNVPGLGEKAPDQWNHGFAFSNGYIYLSTPTAVTRWQYTAGNRDILDPSKGTVVVQNISAPRDSSGNLVGSITRTLTFHNTNTNHLFVSIGNVADDVQNPQHGLVRWFDVSSIPNGGYDFYQQGNIWADGIRNAVGMTFDTSGNLWAADLGSDITNRTIDSLSLDDSHEQSPLDEINVLKNDSFYGWPWCFTAGGNGPSASTQLSWSNSAPLDNAWCQNTTNNVPPNATMPAHSSPLAMTFFGDNNGCGFDTHSFPCEMKGDMFLTVHGSVTSKTPKGYNVVRLPFSNGAPIQSRLETVFEVENAATLCKDEGTPKAFTKCVRPVGITFDNRGRLFIGSDSTNEIYMVHFHADSAAAAGNGLSTGAKGGIVAGVLIVLLVIIGVVYWRGKRAARPWWQKERRDAYQMSGF
ncbi:hypothetical protein HDV00_011728 [Rhizophlyctis rosea]|nr:hypothetical protein HDV00_011728 [Rhizophlyctis rosea]